MDELYVIARRVLLDALEALGGHRTAVALVGAQAVYLRVGEADLAIAPYTTDSDLAIDPSVLATAPPLEQALGQAGFSPKGGGAVGIWITTRRTSRNPKADIGVDLLVPGSVSPGKGRRAARLPGHDPLAARIVRGIEGALVDVDRMSLQSLEVDDPRKFDIQVAGPAALLAAKVHKIGDRDETRRLSDKDALDVFRLLRGTATGDLVERYERLLADPRSAGVAQTALGLLREQFTGRRAPGIQMIERAARSLADIEELAASCEALVGDFFDSLGR